jgi:chromosome partitioning protein
MNCKGHKLVRVLAIISQKGGVGKTTLATSLAVAAEREGKRVALFDLDPQASATFWKDTRASDRPAVASCQSVRLGHLLKAAAEHADLAIIDAPPFAKDIAFEAAEHADLILIPTKPAVLDVMSMSKTLALLRSYAKPASVVLTFCPVQGKEVGEMEAAIGKLGANVCPVRIHHRIAYPRAQQTGLTAQEFEPEGKAADELQRLWRYVFIHLFTNRAMNHAA